MLKLKALCKAMCDDLKDAEMMIKYACDIKKENEKDRPLADHIAKYAQYRLDHFTEFHKLFKDELQQEKHPSCCEDELHEVMQEWYESVKTKINKYD